MSPRLNQAPKHATNSDGKISIRFMLSVSDSRNYNRECNATQALIILINNPDSSQHTAFLVIIVIIILRLEINK